MEERNTLKRKVERLSARGSVDTLLEEEVSTLRVRLFVFTSFALGSCPFASTLIFFRLAPTFTQNRKCCDAPSATTT
jgi:hypothetical protein